MLRFIFRLVRAAFLTVLGAALAAKFLLESNAEPDTEEIDLVAIFEGRELVSSADPFYGGKVLNMFGGTAIDLRKATPSPTGILLDLVVVVGGVMLILPPGWRVEFDGKVYLGGFSDEIQTTGDEDSPVVRLSGLVVAGGVQAVTRAAVEAVV